MPGEIPSGPSENPEIQVLQKEIESLVKAINAGTGATTTVNLTVVRTALAAAQTSLGTRYEPLLKQVLDGVHRIQRLTNPAAPAPTAIPDILAIPAIARAPLVEGLTKAIANLNAAPSSERETKTKEYIQKVRGDLAALRQKIEADAAAQKLSKEDASKKTLDEATRKQIDAIRALIENAPDDIRSEEAWKTFREQTLKSVESLGTLSVAQAQEQLQKLAPNMPAGDPSSVMADNIDARLTQLVRPDGPLAPLFQMLQKQLGMTPESTASMILASVRGFFADYLTGIQLPAPLRDLQANLRNQGVALKWRTLLQQEIRTQGIVISTATAGLNPLGSALTATEAQQASQEPSTLVMMQRLGLDDAARQRFFNCYGEYMAVRDGGNANARPPTIANVRTEALAKQYSDALRAPVTAPATTPPAGPENAPIGGLAIPALGLDVGTTESKITHDSKEVKFVKSNTNEHEYRVGFGTAPNARSVILRVGAGTVNSTKLLRPESGTATGDVRVQLNGQTAVKLGEVVTKMESDTNAPRRTHLKIESGNLTLES